MTSGKTTIFEFSDTFTNRNLSFLFYSNGLNTTEFITDSSSGNTWIVCHISCNQDKNFLRIYMCGKTVYYNGYELRSQFLDIVSTFGTIDGTTFHGFLYDGFFYNEVYYAKYISAP